MARAPTKPAPIAMLTAEISSSACSVKTSNSFGRHHRVPFFGEFVSKNRVEDFYIHADRCSQCADGHRVGVDLVAQFLFHVNLSPAVSPGKGQDSGLDVCLEAHESGVGGSGDADPGADLLHDSETFIVIVHL